LAHDIRRDARAAVAHVKQRSATLLPSPMRTVTAPASCACASALQCTTRPSGMSNSAATAARRVQLGDERSGRVTRCFYSMSEKMENSGQRRRASKRCGLPSVC
jgi:hypothetical protein